MLRPIKNLLLKDAKALDPTIKDLIPAEQWYKIKIHRVSLDRYLKKEGLNLLKEEIETTNSLNLPLPPRWLGKDLQVRYNKEEIAFSSIIITVRNRLIADQIIAKGLYFRGQNHKSERFIEIGPQDIYLNCCEFGHKSHQKCEKKPKCYLCSGNHSFLEHKCAIKGCTAPTGKSCTHIANKCVTCGGAHLAISELCPRRRELVKLAKEQRQKALDLKESRKRIEVVIPHREITISEGDD